MYMYAVIGLRSEFCVDSHLKGENKPLYNDTEKYYLRVYGTAVRFIKDE